MSLSTLTASIDRCRAFADRPLRKAVDPYSRFSDGMSYSGFDQSGDDAEDQLSHYRETFYSAARIVVARVAAQPVYAAQLAVRGVQNSLSSLMQQGIIPQGGVPHWLGMTDRLRVLTAHPILSVLSDPNEHQTSYNMWEMVTASLMATGRGFLVAFASERKDRAFDLYAVPATWMKRAKGGGWEIKPPDSMERPIPVPDVQVCYFYFADPSNPASALSPLQMVGRAVLCSEAISGSQYAEFKQGAVPKVALIAGDVMQETSFTDDPNRTSSARPIRLEPHQRRQIITWFQQQYAGPMKQGLPIVLDAVIRDIKVLSRRPAEMGYLESARLTREEIYAAIGVPEILSGKLENVNRSSGGLAEQIFTDNCLNPIITLISQAMTKKFGALFSVNGEKLVIWVQQAVPRDPELDMQLLHFGIRSYSLLRNEVRQILRQRFGGLSYLPGMDDVVVPQTMEPMDADDDRPGVGRLGQVQMEGKSRIDRLAAVMLNGNGRH